MASAASRLRGTKGEMTEETKKNGDTGTRAGLFTRAARVVGGHGIGPGAASKGAASKGAAPAEAAGPGKRTFLDRLRGPGPAAGSAGAAGSTRKTTAAGKGAAAGKTAADKKTTAGWRGAFGRKGAGEKAAAGKSTGGKGAAGKGATAAKAGTERRPLPLPLRLLAMALAFAAMVAFAVVLADLTLDPSPASVSIAHTNLHPGATLKLYLEQPAFRDAVKQIGGNVLLGVPFGILVPVLAPGARGVLKVLLLTAVVMLLVELAQGALVTGRAFDVDDVILNTAGALLGWLLLGRLLGRAVHARKRKA